ncbi:MAG: protein translocase subunit SecF [Caldilineales bacterium]|nr:protein translocase subunit SecF [Caldilineales bacterium]MCW5858489.1 protein translocase subunit SecF [Caldilineales bacterium]
MNIIKHRRWYYLLSALVILPGVISMIASTIVFGSPVRLSVDFTGGALWEVRFADAVAPAQMVQLFQANGFADVDVNTVGDDRTLEIRTDDITAEQKTTLLAAMEAKFGKAPEELQFTLVGPSIGQEVTRAAFVAVFFASIAILLFIIWAFRNIPHSVRYGVSAIVAMLHDVLVTLGFISIMGWVAGWEADALTLTALLTIIGFSVQDTIVVFDRIRENTRRRRGEDYETIVNRSLLETIHRSLATQINAMFVMVALLLFGGVTIRPFIATLLVGLLSGTYSSIFNATPLVVSWEKGELTFWRRDRQKNGGKRTPAPA